MDKIEKFISSLNKNLREQIKPVILKIVANDLSGIKIKKLKGFDDLFSVRKGKIRIVFRHKNNLNIIINIDYRDKVYKDLE